MRILFWIVYFKGGKRKYWTLAIAVCLISLGCATNKPVPPQRQWRWENEQLYAQRDSGIISKEQVSHEFTIARNKCKIEALRISIPSPSCTQPPRQDCTGLTGFALGFCRSYAPPPDCNYSSVDAARAAQNEVFESCMNLNGWRRVWLPYEQPK